MDLTSARGAVPPGPYLVAGLGRAGLAAARRLKALAAADAVVGWDQNSDGAVRFAARELERGGVRVTLGGDGLRLLEGPESVNCIIKSPGIPASNPLLVQARRMGISVMDELELGWRLDGRPVVAVTGTNGKSTVASLAVGLLGVAGQRPMLAGNVYPGPALTALAPEDGDVVVCEVSSFQLESCPTFVPEVAVLTSFSHDHLDRHVTME